MITAQDFFESVWVGYPAAWRRGQAAFNGLADVRPDLAGRVRGGPVDPFFSDDRIENFRAFIAEQWGRPLPGLRLAWVGSVLYREGGECAAPSWVAVSLETRPPSGKKVLATYRNANGYRRRVCAEWIAAGAHEADADEGDSLDLVYDEARDLYTYPEGWYEVVENWDEFRLVMISGGGNGGEVTHWRELPEFPDDGREGPGGGE